MMNLASVCCFYLLPDILLRSLIRCLCWSADIFIFQPFQVCRHIVSRWRNLYRSLTGFNVIRGTEMEILKKAGEVLCGP